MDGEILVVAVEKVDTYVLAHLCAVITETFGRACRVGEALPVPTDAFNPRREQFAAETILQRLHPGQAERVLGVVDLDLYVPQLNFVFGLADRAEKRA